MFEVEVKVKINNQLEIEKKLLSLGAKKIAILEHYDTYYNTPSSLRDFRKTDEALRLRISIEKDIKNEKTLHETCDLTYKGPKLDKKVKTRTEHIANLKTQKDGKKIHLILLALGFKEVITLHKKRIVYHISYEGENIEVLIDKVKDLEGTYLEAELIAKNKEEITYVKRKILSFLKELKIKEEEAITDSYLELVLKSKKR